MRDLTKNLTSFSWALSLFGARQLGRFADPREVRAGSETQQSFDRVTGAVVDQLGDNLRRAFDVGDRVQREIVDLMFGFVGLGPSTAGATRPAAGSSRGGLVPADWTGCGGDGARRYASLPIFEARSTAREEVLISYTRGTGTFSADKRYIGLSNTLYDLDGREDGRHEGVWEALFRSPEELLAQPPPPTGPMDRPVGPVTAWPVSANTIAKWIHADGSSISSVGPAASHLIPLSDGSFLFLVITAQIITEGTGRFAGGRGLTQSLGATHVPRGENLFTGDATSFPATTLDTFRVKRVGGGGAPRPTEVRP